MDYKNAAFVLRHCTSTFGDLVDKRIIDIDLTNENGESLLWVATNRDEIEALLSRRINLDIQDKKGDTWLHGRMANIVKIFYDILKSNKYTDVFNPNIKNKKGQLILDIWNDTKCRKLFFEYTEAFSEQRIDDGPEEDRVQIGPSSLKRIYFDECKEVVQMRAKIVALEGECTRIKELDSVLLESYKNELETIKAENANIKAKFNELKALLSP